MVDHMDDFRSRAALLGHCTTGHDLTVQNTTVLEYLVGSKVVLQKLFMQSKSFYQSPDSNKVTRLVFQEASSKIIGPAVDSLQVLDPQA